MWTSIALAFRILTILPAVSVKTPDKSTMKQAITIFPLIGCLLGIMSGAAWMVAVRLWSGTPFIAAGFAILTTFLLTGGRMLNALGRTADAIVSIFEDRDRSKALAIIRDPHRTGTGIAAIIVFTFIKAALLSSLTPGTGWQIIIISAALGQWTTSFIYSAFRLIPAWNNDDILNAFGEPRSREFLVATIYTILIAAILPIPGYICFLTVAFVAGILSKTIDRQFNGVSVFAGLALSEIAEITALAIFTLKPA